MLRIRYVPWCIVTFTTPEELLLLDKLKSNRPKSLKIFEIPSTRFTEKQTAKKTTWILNSINIFTSLFWYTTLLNNERIKEPLVCKAPAFPAIYWSCLESRRHGEKNRAVLPYYWKIIRLHTYARVKIQFSFYISLPLKFQKLYLAGKIDNEFIIEATTIK